MICFLCKKEKECPCLQDMYTTKMPDTPIIRVRICSACKQDLEECVSKINRGIHPETASRELELALDQRMSS